jgi:hypothetical protein
MIRSLADVNAAVSQGRVHVQRFIKNAGTAHALEWADPTFASGQPAYDAHVGSPVTFTPAVAAKNDAVYFPDVLPGQSRHLLTWTLWHNQATYNGPGSAVLFDLLGFYPLIDGDSADEQSADNALELPRYADGDGVSLVIVNHVAPAVQEGVAVISYTDHAGVDQTTTVRVPNRGVNLVCSGSDGATANAIGAYAVPLGNGSRGVRKVNSITYTTPPGGLHCLYLVKPLATIITGDNLVAVEKEFATKNAFHLPQILDGAWLGWFDRIGSGTARAVNWFGNFTFVWG